jgi:hypothetical protein
MHLLVILQRYYKNVRSNYQDIYLIFVFRKRIFPFNETY